MVVEELWIVEPVQHKIYVMQTDNVYAYQTVQVSNADLLDVQVLVVEPAQQEKPVMVVDNAFVHQQHVQL